MLYFIFYVQGNYNCIFCFGKMLEIRKLYKFLDISTVFLLIIVFVFKQLCAWTEKIRTNKIMFACSSVRSFICSWILIENYQIQRIHGSWVDFFPDLGCLMLWLHRSQHSVFLRLNVRSLKHVRTQLPNGIQCKLKSDINTFYSEYFLSNNYTKFQLHTK